MTFAQAVAQIAEWRGRHDGQVPSVYLHPITAHGIMESLLHVAVNRAGDARIVMAESLGGASSWYIDATIPVGQVDCR